MEKIGLVISVASGGKSDPFSVNASPSWSRLVIDLREELKAFSGIDSNTKLTRLSFVENGALITTISPISGREGDYKSSWVFVPATASISGLEMAQILDFTRTELNGSRINEERLSSFFSKEYPSSSVSALKKIPVQTGIAYRYYGGDTFIELHELLGEKLYQSYYLNYSAVYLIDKETNHSTTCSGINLTDRKVKDIITVEPPKTCDGFTPYLNETAFLKPITITEGETLTIKWVKERYQPIEKTWSASKQVPIPTPIVSEYKRKVTYRSIAVCDQWGQSIRNYVLRINGATLNEGEYLPVSEAKIRECEVCVFAEGFHDYKEVRDLSESIRVKMRNVRYSYTYKIPLADYCEQKYGEFTLESDEPLKEVPFKGYRIDDKRKLDKGKYNVYVTPANKTKGKVLLFAGLALLVSLLLGFCGGVILMSVLKKDNNAKHAVETSYGTASSQSSTDVSQNKPENNGGVMSKVTDYLDTHEKWNRNEMAKFPEISGLWDAINNRDFDQILIHEEQLKGSTRFKELVQAVKDNQKKSFPQPYITSPNDVDITIGNRDTKNSYIQRLYNAPEPGVQTGSQTGGRHSSGHQSSGQNINNTSNNNNDQDQWN